jgi:hypothetical protein
VELIEQEVAKKAKRKEAALKGVETKRAKAKAVDEAVKALAISQQEEGKMDLDTQVGEAAAPGGVVVREPLASILGEVVA